MVDFARRSLATKIRRPLPGLQRRPSAIEPGGLEGGGFESGLLKMGIEGGGSLVP